MANDITKSLETLLKRHSYVTGSFIKKIIKDEIKNKNKSTELNIIPRKYDDLIDWIKSELGHPVIHIGVDNKHYEQAIYSAIQLWWQHHYDGSYIEYKAIKVTQSMIDNNEIIIQSDVESILSVTVIHNNTTSEPVMSSNLDWYEYNTYHTFNMNNTSLNGWQDIPLASMLALEMNMANMQSLFKKNVLFRYHRYDNRLSFIDSTLKKLSTGSLVLIEAYKNVDPVKVESMFDDIWIKEYSRERLKLIWGTILKAIKNVPLIAGVSISGDEIYSEAKTEISRLEIQLTEKYEHPPMFYWG
jgi:hypothetical protein